MSEPREAAETPFMLLVNGEEFTGWQSLRITRGLERACADFDLSVSERWGIDDDAWQIQPGAECEIRLNDEKVLTGYVDAYRPSYDSGSHAIQLTGRSKTCDIVDSSVTVDGGQFKGLTVAAIARQLCQPFGIEVAAEIEGEPEPEVQVQQGETVFGLIERLSRLQEILVTDDASGRLVLCRAGSANSATALVHGENILRASAELDHSKRFSEYIVKAQRPGNRTKDGGSISDDWPGLAPVGYLRSIPNISERYREYIRLRRLAGGKKTAPKTLTQIVGRASDPGIARYRPHVIVAEAQCDDAAAGKRADWEMRRRLATATRATILVNGWRQEDGALWVPNLMVQCTAEWLSLERELIVAETEFSYDESGEITQLQLTLPDAFLPEAKRKGKKPKEEAKGGGKGKKGKKKGGGGEMWAGLQGV